MKYSMWYSEKEAVHSSDGSTFYVSTLPPGGLWEEIQKYADVSEAHGKKKFLYNTILHTSLISAKLLKCNQPNLIWPTTNKKSSIYNDIKWRKQAGFIFICEALPNKSLVFYTW